MTNWWRDVPLKLHLDYHEPHWMTGVAGAFDLSEARRQAAMFKAAGIGAVSYFTHDHHGFAFWPTRSGVAHPGLTNDYVGHMSTALQEAGIRRIAYFQIFSNIHIKREHADWLVVAPEGGNPPGAWLQYGASAVCASSPFLDEYIAPLLTELLTSYDIEAMWFDGGAWMVDTLCHCRYCQDGFRTDTGRDLPVAGPIRPRGMSVATSFEPSARSDEHVVKWTTSDAAGDDDPDWVAWRIWRRAQIARFVRRVTAICKAARPDVLVTDNSIGRWNMPILDREADGTATWLSTQNLGLDYLCNDPVPWGGDFPLQFSLVGRGEATSGMPFDFHNIRFHKWGEWQLRKAQDMIVDAGATLAQGTALYFADQPYPDGTLEPAVYATFAEVDAATKGLMPALRASVALPDIAVLASAASQMFGPIGGGVNAGRKGFSPVGSEVVGQREDRVTGAHLALVQSGVQFLIYDEATLCQSLDRQGLVIIPEQCLLSDATISALGAYVKAGGGLLVTGRSGWWDDQYRSRSHDRLDAILGIRTLGVHPAPLSYVQPDADWTAAASLPNHPIMHWGTAVRFELAGAKTLAQLRGPLDAVWRDGVKDEAHWQHYTTIGACPPGGVVGPAVTVNHYGRGQAAFMAIDPFAPLMHENQQYMLDCVLAAMESVYPAAERLVTVAGRPNNVEVSVQTDGAETLVHLVGYGPARHHGVMMHSLDLSRLDTLTLSLRRDNRPSHIVDLHSGSNVAWEWREGRVMCKVPPFESHALLKIG